MSHNPNKTITANSKGLIISFRDNTKPRYIAYKSVELAKLQQNGRARYQPLDKPVFNRMQRKLYSEVLFGIKAYEQTELMSLAPKEVRRITALHRKAQFFLSKWKQEIMDNRVNDFLMALFPKSLLAKQMCAVKGYNRAHTDRHSFKELGLSQQTVAEKLIEVGFLPANFFQLA